MTNQELNNFTNVVGATGKVIVNDMVFEEAFLEESINGDGGLTLGWNSTAGSGLGVGSTAGGGYVLLSPYLPSRNSNGAYRYSPKFSDAMAALGKRLFYKTVQVKDKEEAEGHDTFLYTFNYVGIPSAIITALGDAAGCNATLHSVSSDVNPLISVSFDGDSIKSAANKIASALGVPVWYTPGEIHFGAPEGMSSIVGDYYNTFVVLGGTRNMTKRIVTNSGVEYAAVTQRLTLDNEGSKIGGGTPELTKILVFDNIFPRVRMRIGQVYERRLYLLDDKGEKIAVGTHEVAGETVTDYAQYSKWYITLENIDGEGAIDQAALDGIIIDGTTLRLQFLPFADGGTSPLAGREFELVHFTSAVKELQEDDLEATMSGGGGYVINEAMAAAGNWYRIVANADAGTQLPTTQEGSLIPKAGDIVSLVNVAVPESCYDAARARLLAAGTEASQAYKAEEPSSYSETYPAGSGTSYSLGEVVGRHMVTNIRTDLITGEVTVTFGTFSQKGILSSMIDKIEGVQVTGGGGTTNSEEQNTRQLGTMSQEQWDALARAGGHKGLVALNKRVKDNEDTMDGLRVDLRNVQQQADESINIYYGATTPTDSNYPAVDWTDDETKELHVGDLYYDENREPASGGGRAWKWTKTAGEDATDYSWEVVTDLDTLAALEKIADVASDGIITGGEEKQRLYFQWKQATVEFNSLTALATTYGLQNGRDYDEYVHDLTVWLGYLNGNATVTSGMRDGSERPAWIASAAMSTSTLLADYHLTPASYRTAKDNLDASSALLRSVVESQAKEALDAISDMGSDSKLTPDEKIILIRDMPGMDSEVARIAVQCRNSNLAQYGTALASAFVAIGTYLNGGTSWSRAYQGGALLLPSWLSDYPSRTEDINADTWHNLWTTYYKERAAAQMALTNKAQQDAAAAIAQAAGSRAVTVSATRPVPAYNAGDMWLDTSSNELWVCQTTRAAGDTPADGDWLLVEAGGSYLSNVTDHYADFATSFCTLVESYYQTREGYTAPSSFKVYIQATQPTGYTTQDVWYEGTDDGVYGTIHWNGHTNYYADDGTSLQDLRASLSEIQSYGFTEFTVYNGTPSGDAQPRNYDVQFKRLSFQDSFTKEMVYGGIDVFVFNAKRSLWEKVQDGVSGLMENYGDHIINAVFGTGDDGVTNYASRLLTAMNFAEMVTEATAQDGDKALAAIRTIVEEVSGQLTGKVKIHADQLDLSKGDESDESGASGLLTMNTGQLSGGSDRQVESGIAIKQGSGFPYAALQTVVTNPYSDGARHYERFDGESEEVDAWSQVRTSLLMLKGESSSNPAAPAYNPASKGITTVSPFKVASRRYEIREYVIENGSWVKKRYKGVGTHSEPVFITDNNGVQHKVIGGIICDEII